MAENEKSDVAKREEEILKFWQENGIFEKTLSKDAPNGEYVFYDGPPFATGLPHYGHILASVVKDAIPRYYTMRGFRVPRVWGWDCHGLPIENIVEKELGFKHKKDIKEYGIAKFNERCREQVLTYASEWEKVIPRIGRWADMKNAYRTMDKPFMESVWWVFKQIYDKGLVYEDYRSMHICPRCETTLSQQEVSEGYKNVKDIAVTVKLELVDEPGTYLLAWTTTPWTLPGNVAAAVHKDTDYVKFKGEGGLYIVAKALFGKFQGEIVEEFKGATLVGKNYKPPFDYYINDKNLKNRENGWKVYHADFVTEDAGTGIAHEAPAFGADDWELLKKENLPFVQHVGYDGAFKPEVTDFAGMEVKPRSDDDKTRLGADIAILKYLQEKGLFFAKENITHAYPHCWRCDTPLLNYATSSWFVNVTALKDKMLANAKPINWSPAHIKEGRWGKWIEGARDWSISRQRFWASVIPLWACEACKTKRVFGSAQELEEASGKKVDDLHKHIVDEITVPCSCGKTMRRIPDVLDTWFDSGSMPYGQKHYPFEEKEKFEKTFPAQFIAESLDQTRAWFYYLHVLGSALFNKPAFKNVIVNGIVLAEDGKKMSKKLKNYPDPMDVVNKYGADALRYYLLTSPVAHAENLSFSEAGVDEIVKKNINRLTNVVAFYKLYEDGTGRSNAGSNILDRWILARLSETVEQMSRGFEKYELDSAVRPVAGFIDDLSVWYLRRSRERLKEEGEDKKAALQTLRYVLFTFAKAIAPAMPFIAEEIYQEIKEKDDPESVHLCEWPGKKKSFFSRFFGAQRDSVIPDMEDVRRIVSVALEKRAAANIKVRQPLSRLTIRNGKLRDQELTALIEDEVNVKLVSVNVSIRDEVELDTNITRELKEEGVVREVLRFIQDLRKQGGFSPKDKAVLVAGDDTTRVFLETHWGPIQKTANVVELRAGDASQSVTVDGAVFNLDVRRA